MPDLLRCLKLCTYSFPFEKSSKTNKLVFQFSLCKSDNKSSILWAGLRDNDKQLR